MCVCRLMAMRLIVQPILAHSGKYPCSRGVHNVGTSHDTVLRVVFDYPPEIQKFKVYAMQTTAFIAAAVADAHMARVKIQPSAIRLQRLR